MKKFYLYLGVCVILLITSCSPGSRTKIVKFDGPLIRDSVTLYRGPYQEEKWALKELNPELPSDWEPFNYLTFEMKSTSSQRFELRLYDTEGMRRIHVYPYEMVRVRASIPLARFRKINTQGTTASSTYHEGLPSCWIRYHQGPFGSLNHIDSLGVVMVMPLDSPTLEISNVHLSMVPEDSVFSPVPLIDEFGQWMADDWPGKVKTLDDLRIAWSEEEKSLQADSSAVSKYGGFPGTRLKATGFFRVEKLDDRWWFVDPEGYLFFSAGCNCITPVGSFSRIQGREYLFKEFLPDSLFQSERRDGRASFSTWNLYRRFGPDWFRKWMDFAIRRMDSWGLNTIANWSDNTLAGSKRKPYVASIGGWGTNSITMGMPDVYADDYDSLVNASAARQCEHRKDDPYLLGYFIGNEPIWPGRELELIDIILNGKETPMQVALKKFLAVGDTPEQRIKFVYDTYTKFVSIVNQAIKKHDPNHLNLGFRFSNLRYEESLVKASKDCFDVFSLNYYGYEVNPYILQNIYESTGLPIVIGEFHFGTIGQGLAPGHAPTINQEERGVAYRYYVEKAAAHPAVVGIHWFQWQDQPATGRGDGENYSTGLVDITDRPYKELVDAVRTTNKRILDIHSGKESPVSRQAITYKEY